jgi:2-polyprenyl-6-methoxyphenol hydroxylase-like FAD-dependent oxidoreductase
MPDFDAVVVGASLAGCATAIHLGRAGHRVALVDKRPDPAAYKRVCGHFVQSSAVPALERLGVLEELEAAGAVRGHARVWSPYGWFGEPESAERRPSLSIRREKLDPLLRRRAAETPGVELMLGHALTGTAPAAEGRRVELSRGPALTTRLLVGADGRGSRTASLAGVRTRASANARFAYWGYFEGPPLGTGASVHIWFLGRDIGIATPTDGGLMLYVAFPGTERAKAFKADIEGELRAFVGALPDAPPIAESRLAGPLVGKLDLTNEWRRPTGHALALAGDAALAADPVGAVGCGWAVQSAEWLAQAVSPALHGERTLPGALRAYRRRHRRELLGHSLMAADAARGRPMAPPQRLLFAAAVHDPVTARRIADFAGREVRPHTLLSPRALARAALVVARTRAPQPRRAARTAAP